MVCIKYLKEVATPTLDLIFVLTGLYPARHLLDWPLDNPTSLCRILLVIFDGGINLVVS